MAAKKRKPYNVKPRDPRTLQETRRALFYPKKIPTGWQILGRKVGAVNVLSALLFGFKVSDTPEEKEFFFWEIANLLWNKDPDDRKFAKHKWSYHIIHNACREKYLAIGGAGNSGKSYTCAGWGVVSWLADPANTLVLFTSTDLKGAKARVWGAMSKLLSMVPNPPCKFNDSIGVIKYFDGTQAFDTGGLRLVTADKSTSKDKVGKMIGIKAKKLILIADELGEMGPNVQSAATGNLSGNESFQMIGLSNPASRFDPFGLFATPKAGWESLSENDLEWRTKVGGLYIRFDSGSSPNIDTDTNPEYESGEFYPYLPTTEKINEKLESLGSTPEEARKSREFMRFDMALFHDSDEEESVYSEAEFLRAGALDKTKLHEPTKMAGCDPSYSSGGDSTVIAFIEEGFDLRGQHSIQLTELVYLYEDMTDSENPRTLQIADKIIRECKKRGVTPENFAIDSTSGAGKGLCDVLQLQWGTNVFMRVEFGGAASNRRIKNTSKLTGKDRYKNKASEIFFVGKQYLLGRQIYGIPPIIAKQMCQRLCLEPVKGPLGMILGVEPKKFFRARCGKSPDEADAFLVAVDGARTRRNFMPADPKPKGDQPNIPKWLQSRRTHGSYADDRLGFVGGL